MYHIIFLPSPLLPSHLTLPSTSYCRHRQPRTRTVQIRYFCRYGKHDLYGNKLRMVCTFLCSPRDFTLILSSLNRWINHILSQNNNYIIRKCDNYNNNNDDCADQQSSCVDSTVKGGKKNSSSPHTDTLSLSLSAAFGKTFNSPSSTSTSTSILNATTSSTPGSSTTSNLIKCVVQGSAQGSVGHALSGQKQHGTRLKRIASSGTGTRIPPVQSQTGECCRFRDRHTHTHTHTHTYIDTQIRILNHEILYADILINACTHIATYYC